MQNITGTKITKQNKTQYNKYFQQLRRKKNLPERCPISLVVHDAHACIPPTGKIIADDRHRHGIGTGTLQKPAVLPDHVIPLIARQLEETLASEDDGAVREVRVGEDKVGLAFG